MTHKLTDLDTVTLRYFMNSQYSIDGKQDLPDSTTDHVTTSPILEPYKERIIQLFNNMVHETPTAEITDKLESIFGAFICECISMYKTIDAMPQQRSLETIDTQDIAIHELDKNLVKQIGTSGKQAMEDFVRYNSVSKLPEPPRTAKKDIISSYNSATNNGNETDKKTPITKSKKIIKRKKKPTKDTSPPENKAARKKKQRGDKQMAS